MILKDLSHEQLKINLQGILKPGITLKLKDNIRRSLEEYGSNDCKSKYRNREAEFEGYHKNSLSGVIDFNRVKLKRTKEEINKSQRSFPCWSFHILDLDLDYLQRYVTVEQESYIKPVLFDVNNLCL